MKKLFALILVLCLSFCTVSFAEASDDSEHHGTIMWLSNLQSGISYENTSSYLTALCDSLGYDFTIVYGDSFNDASGNLQAVKNGMTNDVVGLIASQDGGIASIMEEYPDLYVVGYNTDLRSVYEEGGVNAACLDNDHFFGTIVDGYSNGYGIGEIMAQRTIEQGFQKVAIVSFPAYAYPFTTEADNGYRDYIAAYNESADQPVEIVGDTTVLMFSPLEDSWFLESGHEDINCIIALCHGMMFVYPTMVTAMANGMCAPDTKLITGGFDDNAEMVSSIGEEGIIDWIYNSPAENCAYPMILLDNAITGNMYSDTQPLCVDSLLYIIQSKEDIDNVMTKSLFGTNDLSLAQVSVEEAVSLCGRNNPDMTQSKLIDFFHSDQLSVESLKNR